MSGVERLRDVWRREFDDYSLPAFGRIFGVLQAKVWVKAEGGFSFEN